MARRVDVRHDVSAVGGADLIEIGVFGDVETGAVGSQSGAEAGRRARRQRTSRGCSSDQNRGGTHFPDEIFQNSGIGFDAEILKFRLVIDENFVCAVFENHFRLVPDSIADHEAVDRIVHFRGKLAHLPDQFEGDRMNGAFRDLRHHGDSAPFFFLDHGQIFFDIFKDVARFFDADAAHAASGVDGKSVIDQFNGFERAERGKTGFVLRFFLMNFNIRHGGLPQLLKEFFVVKLAEEPFGEFVRRAFPHFVIVVAFRGKDAFDLRRRAVQTVMFRIRVLHVVESEHADRTVRRRKFELERGKARFEDSFFDGQEAGVFDFRRFDVERQVEIDRDVRLRDLADFADARHMGDSEEFREFGSDLCRVAVGGLFAADDHVASSRGGDALRQSVGGREHIGTAEPAVRQDDSVVDPHHEGFPDDGFRLRRAHGYNSDFRSVTLFEPESRFQSVQIVRIHFRFHAVALENARFRINLHLRGAGNLLDADYDFHAFPLLI